MYLSNSLKKLPQGILLNKKVIFSITIGGLAFALVFIWLLSVSAPKARVIKEEIPRLDTQSAVSMIQALENESIQVEVKQADIEEPVKETAPMSTTTIPTMPVYDEIYKQGTEASISVYHGQEKQIHRPENKSEWMKPTSAQVPMNTSAEMVNEYKQQNQQEDKQAFLAAHQQQQGQTRLLNYQTETSPFAIKAGSVIPATMQVDINSDLPGTITAKVRQSVYDTATGQHQLIPQGTTLIGQYDSAIAYGQQRILIAWDRLIFPNGNSFDIQGQPGVDGLGAAGLKDKVNRHLVKTFSSSLLFSIISAGGSMGREYDDEDASAQAIIAESIGQQMAQTSLSLLSKSLNIQSTLIVRAGMRFNVLLRQDLVFPDSYKG